jgi:hypothetical protein
MVTRVRQFLVKSARCGFKDVSVMVYMPLLSYVSIPIQNHHEKYVRVAVDHPWTLLPHVTMEDVLENSNSVLD